MKAPAAMMSSAPWAATRPAAVSSPKRATKIECQQRGRLRPTWHTEERACWRMAAMPPAGARICKTAAEATRSLVNDTSALIVANDGSRQGAWASQGARLGAGHFDTGIKISAPPGRPGSPDSCATAFSVAPPRRNPLGRTWATLGLTLPNSLSPGWRPNERRQLRILLLAATPR